MATTIITGRDLALTINSVDYGAQASSVTMSLENDRQEYDVLDGTVYKTVKTTGTLSVELMQDWGLVSGSICEALWNAAKSAPDTPIAFSFTANTGSVFTGNVYPVFPDAGGAAADALMATLEFTIQDGDVTLA
jgi:uncharacterized protein with NAD-binding domain and iron-sulfur cluster